MAWKGFRLPGIFSDDLESFKMVWEAFKETGKFMNISENSQTAYRGPITAIWKVYR